jgi:hypothetical protein
LRKNIRKIRDDLELEKATQVSANNIKRKSLRVSRAHFPLVNHEKIDY